MADVHVRLNRCAHPAEFNAGELAHVLKHPAVTPEILEGQHPIRAWEYSQALRALERHIEEVCLDPADPQPFEKLMPLTGSVANLCDVGGAGSNFWKTLLPYTTRDIIRVDPAGAGGEVGRYQSFQLSLAAYVRLNGQTALFDAVFCLSVIEHVGDVQPFLDDLCALVRPGGLLVLTCDTGPGTQLDDTYHFHWMRKWIASPGILDRLTAALQAKDFQPLGDVDFTYHGPTVFDYTVASLAFVRKGHDV